MTIIAGHDDALTPVQARAWKKALTWPELFEGTIDETISDLNTAWCLMIELDPATIVGRLMGRKK